MSAAVGIQSERSAIQDAVSSPGSPHSGRWEIVAKAFHRGGRITRAAAVACLILPTVTAASEEPERAQGQLALYTVKSEREAEFAEGYARHLLWHVNHNDTWAWYVWAIVTGERHGRYVGGSFGHAWSDLGRRPQPGQDGADHARNVDRNLEQVSSRMVERRLDLGGELPALETAPLLAAFEMNVRPGARTAFEDALHNLLKLRATRSSAAYGWLEVVNGDRVPTYLLVVPLAGRPDLQHVRYQDLGSASEERGATREAADRALLAVESVRSEVWSFRPDISTCLLAETKCLGVAGSAGAPPKP